ncbi:mitochondrial transcription rescue factor 1 [Vanessa cardui]|uniref:mitochondrial transcription rescue factor 1 n=1 Tax=Vanessa cardui TaxID=171605 RepID=UPI001F13189F|nr:mitochondrial transcription rescue factor 1 [Vanessa cardui]
MNIIRRQSYITSQLLRVIVNEIRTKPQIINFSQCSKTLTSTKLVNSKLINFSCDITRSKSKKKIDADSDDEAEIFDDDISLSRDSKIVKIATTSLRTDAVLKSALGIARNKIEKLFYESKIRVNGKKILKKSMPVQVDYELDVIKSVSPKNPEHLYISRVEILNIVAKEESILVTARRFKTLLIENYENDPYKPSTSDEDQ